MSKDEYLKFEGMKLAEALSIRKDLQKRIQQLGQRIQNNVKVQEGDDPKEQPAELMKELDSCLSQLQELIWRINATMPSGCGALPKPSEPITQLAWRITLSPITIPG